MVHKNGLARRTLKLEQLDSRQLMAVDVLEVEANNSEGQATRFELGSEAVRLLGTSIGKDDKDYFAFTASSDQRVQVSVASATVPSWKSTRARAHRSSRANRKTVCDPVPGRLPLVKPTCCGCERLIAVRLRTKSRLR